MVQSTAGTLVASLLLVAPIACRATDESAERPHADTPEEAPAPAPATDPAGRLIHPDGIAHARIGMTIGELRAALPAGTMLHGPAPFMVDIDGMPVVSGRDTLYYVLVPAESPIADRDTIELLATTDTSFRTAEGVGPGTTLGEATAILGMPTLAYHTGDESREYATFPGLPRTIRLRTAPASDTAWFAGIYATNDEYNETARFEPDARISLVMVVPDYGVSP